MLPITGSAVAACGEAVGLVPPAVGGAAVAAPPEPRAGAAPPELPLVAGGVMVGIVVPAPLLEPPPLDPLTGVSMTPVLLWSPEVGLTVAVEEVAPCGVCTVCC